MNDASMTEMSETGKVKFFLSPSNRLLSASSGEDVVGCEEIVERVAHIYRHEGVAVIMQPQSETPEFDAEVSVVKGAVPGNPPPA